MPIYQIIILAIIQGAAELLPVSSSAHVIIAQKLMGLDPSAPEMTFMLVMLHTGTMFATIIYFWKPWKAWFEGPERNLWLRFVAEASLVTIGVGLGIKFLIERLFFHGTDFEIEDLFKRLPLIATALFAVGLFIIFAGKSSERVTTFRVFNRTAALWIGVVQGLALPFRGFSRSGATISTGLVLGLRRLQVEEFSFLLAVVLTPPVIVRSIWRLLKHSETRAISLADAVTPGLIGMFASFAAGFVALKFLTAILDKGRWSYFGVYCLFASAAVVCVHFYLS